MNLSITLYNEIKLFVLYRKIEHNRIHVCSMCPCFNIFYASINLWSLWIYQRVQSFPASQHADSLFYYIYVSFLYERNCFYFKASTCFVYTSPYTVVLREREKCFLSIIQRFSVSLYFYFVYSYRSRDYIFW